MKKHINLITRQKKYYQIDEFIRRLRMAVAAFGVFFIVLNMAFFLFLYHEQSGINALTEEKKRLLDFLIQNKESEAKFVYFNSKEKQVAGILKSDVSFYPYYNLLTESLKTASPAGQLQTLVIEKDRHVNFSVSFDNYDSLLFFFKFMETEQFLRNFKDLTLSSVETSSEDAQKIYLLNLSGVFNELL